MPEERVSLRELLEARLDAMDRALELQATEYERRLESLNGEQARIARSQATYVSREIWEAFQAEHRGLMERMTLSQAATITNKEFQEYKDRVDKALQLAAGQKQGVNITTYIVTQVVLTLAGVATMAGVLLAFFRR